MDLEEETVIDEEGNVLDREEAFKKSDEYL